MKKLSIITPSFNQGQFLEQTIDSVLSQGYPNLEYIIIDGGSTDQSVEVIKKYERHLTYWVSEKDKGQSDAINKGLQIATGEIINWINSDDWYLPGVLKQIGRAFEHPDTYVFCGRSNLLRDNKILYQNKGTDIYSSLEKTIGFARIDQPETFFRKSCIDQLGLLNTNLHYVMDRDWWIRYLLLFGTKNVQKTDEVLVNFRLHPNSKTITSSKDFTEEAHRLYYTIATQYNLQEAAVIKSLWNTQIIENATYPSSLPEKNIRQIIQYYFLQQAVIAYAENDFLNAVKIISYMQSGLLNKEDQEELGKIKTRIKYLPIWLKKLLNKR